MSIIDIHTHIFPDTLAPRAMAALCQAAPGMRNETDGTLAGLLASMQSSCVDKSVLLPVATRPDQVTSINRWQASLKNDRCIAFGALHPGMTDWAAEIAFLSSSGIKGVKLHPEYQDFHIDDRACFPLYEALAEAGLMVVFHAGIDPGPFTNDHASPRAIARVVRDFPSLQVVAAHMGGYLLWDEVENELAGLNCYFDTSAVVSGISKEQFIRLTKKHDPQRILFGSDSPWFDQEKSIQFIQSLPLSTREQEMILGENAVHLLAMG